MTEDMFETGDLVPQDINAEMAVLCCCLHSRIARDEARKHLTGRDFWRPVHEQLWDAMAAMDRKKEPVDPASLYSFVSGKPALLALLPVVLTYPTTPESVDTHARVVRGCATKRRLLDQAAWIRQVAMKPDLEAETIAAEAVTRLSDVRNSGVTEDIHSITLGELLASTDDEPDWLIPGLIERRDRLILTGEEGLGKSYLLRQFAIMAAAGMNPFDSVQRIKPVRTMIIDCENSQSQVRRKSRALAGYARQYGAGDPDMVNLLCSPRIDITRDRDLARIHYELDACQPEMVIIGPLYRLTSKALQTDDEAAPVLAALDTIRDRGCALLMEAHAGHAIGRGGHRELRPRGSSALLGWPEFGYGMRTVAQGICDLVPWRGDRDSREWPDRLRIDKGNIRWLPIDATYIGESA